MSEQRLRTDQVATVLDMSASAVIAYTKDGLLRTTRTAGGHRRYDAESVQELARVLAMPEGAWRDHELEALRLRNQERARGDTRAQERRSVRVGQVWDDVAKYYEARGETMTAVVTRLLEAEVQRLRAAGELP